MYLVFVGNETHEREMFGFLDEAVEWVEANLRGKDVYIEYMGKVVWQN
jgi:hypothetical protein